MRIIKSMFLLLTIVILLFSCKGATPLPQDKTLRNTYTIYTYFPDGSVRRIGTISNQKRTNSWVEWYCDGNCRSYVFYDEDGEVMYPQVRPLLKTKLNNSIHKGNLVKIQIAELLPGDSVSANYPLKKIDDPMFDYETILEGDSPLIIHMFLKVDTTGGGRDQEQINEFRI